MAAASKTAMMQARVMTVLSKRLQKQSITLWDFGGFHTMVPIPNPGSSYTTSFIFAAHRHDKMLAVKFNHAGELSEKLAEKIIEKFDSLATVLQEGDPLPKAVPLEEILAETRPTDSRD